MPAPLRILLIEDNPADARLARELLRESSGAAFEVTHVDSLKRGLACLDVAPFDAVLLDLSLTDSFGIESVARIASDHMTMPIIVLSGLADETVALAALQNGAQDYLIKGQGDGYLIGRTIRYAIERKRIEGHYIEAKQAAESADRAKSEFLANMSHELRTPLNAIIGFSEMMEIELLGPLGHPFYKEYAEDIHKSGDHLLEVINDILDLSKISVGKFDLEPSEISLPAAIEECMHMVRMRAEAAGLDLLIDIAPDLQPLHADERLVKRILLNLISNALKFTPEGHIRIAAWAAPEGGTVLAVEDTGIGIAAAELPRLMRPFVQIDGSLARKYQGTGLGLSLVKSAMELHGGDVRLASEPGVGTTVTLRFPPGSGAAQPAAQGQGARPADSEYAAAT